VDVRLGADDVNWLALAKKTFDDEGQLDETEEQLIGLADELGGEFDGLER
jgi:hypothetical protein